MIKKPQLAEDAVLDKLQFPTWEQPKIDGVRGLNTTGCLTGRSLDPFKGYGISEYFSLPIFQYLDGEMILGNKPNCSDRLCSRTTGAMGRIYEEQNKKQLITEMADIHWWVFDRLHPDCLDHPYQIRYELLAKYVAQLNHPRVHLVPYSVCNNMDEVKAAIARNADAGYEGTIFRNPRSKAKPGRSTLEGQLWRVKPWADAEIRVTGITEGSINANEAKKNTLGRTERSSSAAGMIPNGQVGSIQGVMLADFYDPITGKLLFPKGLPTTISASGMTDKEAIFYFMHPEAIIGHIVKFQHMTHGVKDQPRFGTYMSHRLPEDM